MSKKIRMIKENDFFDWKVGDEFVVEGGLIEVEGQFGLVVMVADAFVDSYAEWVEDEQDWEKFIEEKKKEFLGAWGVEEDELEDWQMRMMYEYVLRGCEQEVNRIAEQALEGIKPVLDKLAELKGNSYKDPIIYEDYEDMTSERDYPKDGVCNDCDDCDNLLC
jgi:hypothetical protein